jgi:putative FmdB family regulatory protein
MPTYEYHCDACEHEFEEFQSMNEAALTRCPECGKKKLRRLFGTGAAILFKGSGFYQTDYRSDSYKAAAKADQDAGKPAGDAGSDKATKASSETSAKPEKKSSKSKAAKSDD